MEHFQYLILNLKWVQKVYHTQEADLKTVKDMESFSIAIDGNVQNWNPMDMKGWSRALMTGKKLTISLKGKRKCW
mgnify:CR=1 FL=1